MNKCILVTNIEYLELSPDTVYKRGHGEEYVTQQKTTHKDSLTSPFYFNIEELVGGRYQSFYRDSNELDPTKQDKVLYDLTTFVNDDVAKVLDIQVENVKHLEGLAEDWREMYKESREEYFESHRKHLKYLNSTFWKRIKFVFTGVIL